MQVPSSSPVWYNASMQADVQGFAVASACARASAAGSVPPPIQLLRLESMNIKI